MTNTDHSALAAKLNAETARLPWTELERHFARGALVTVDADLDLIDVAVRMAQDDKASVERWLTEDRIRRTTVDEARRFSAEQRELWCVVVAPWVLVQNRP
ncbi:DUF2288 domain-containing protein [uncultured Pigmentiphaga sp.]|uniref:DUF2288 domain-containing protein n=1 Tax=uncultured Pigmentiphaga sp. TaxID=340361 RepID=UPI00260B977B|nr:DUF2288 domain-containing protein [uncultured Pigmentiphaga sp.]